MRHRGTQAARSSQFACLQSYLGWLEGKSLRESARSTHIGVLEITERPSRPLEPPLLLSERNFGFTHRCVLSESLARYEPKVRETEGSTDCRVAGERQFFCRGEDAHVVGIGLNVSHKRGFGEVHLRG